MDEKVLNQLSQIFIDIENDIGTTKLTILALNAIKDSARKIDCSGVGSIEEFFEVFKDFLLSIRSTKPRIAIIIHTIYRIWEKLFDNKENFKSLDDLYKTLDEEIEILEKEIRADTEKVYELGVNIISENDDVILIHDNSSVIINTLIKAKNAGKKFSVIISEQKKEITEGIIYDLQQNNIDLKTIPEYMLSHVQEEITKVFIGGITLNGDFDFVGSPGTDEIVSEMFHAGKEIFMFMSTKKFSLWQQESKEEFTKPTIQEKHSSNPKIKPYTRLKFSHDRVSVDLFSKIVTQKGIFSPEEIQDLYNKSFEKRKAWREKYFSQSV